MTQVVAALKSQALGLRCPVCASCEVESLVRFDSVPVFCNVLHDTREAAMTAPRAPIELAICLSCTHIFNGAFDASLVAYSAGYENALHHSGTFVDYQNWLVQSLTNTYGLHDKRVVEIGCGQGDFLSALCVSGGNSGIGFDPSYRKAPLLPGIEQIEPRYFKRGDGLRADAVVCRQVLEHIDDPAELLGTIRDELGPGKLVCFEVPNGEWCFGSGGIWDVIYEHCGYFTPPSLRTAFSVHGFEVREVSRAFGGQFLVIVALTGRGRTGATAANGPTADGTRLKLAASVIREHQDAWRSRLGELAATHAPVVIWGAGSKGVTFLNLVANARQVQFAVDVNPAKVGRYVAGSGHLVISPDQLRDVKPATVIVMNPNYEAEVRALLAASGMHPRVVTAQTPTVGASA
jgi:SAM-dependent methyltransferase